MTMSDMPRSKLLDLIAQLRSQKAILQKQYQSQLEKVDNDLQAVERTIQLLTGDEGHKQVSPPQLELNMVDSALLTAAPNHLEAAKIIAKQNNGVINATRTADIFIRTGKSTGKRRNLIASLYAQLKNSDEWEWVSPGTFHLKSTADT